MIEVIACLGMAILIVGMSREAQLAVNLIQNYVFRNAAQVTTFLKHACWRST